MCTRSKALQRTISWKSSRVRSSIIVTWSESQRIGRLTWSISSGTNNNMDETLSAALSVGWKWPVSIVISFWCLHAITYTEFIRTHCIAFQTDTEYFRFQTVLHFFIFRSKNPVERVFKQFTVFHTVYRNILATVVYPKIHDTRIALDNVPSLPQWHGNVWYVQSRNHGCLYPDWLKTSYHGFRMWERVELKSSFIPFSAALLHPAFKMFHFHLVTVNKRTAEITVNFMQIQAMFAGI